MSVAGVGIRNNQLQAETPQARKGSGASTLALFWTCAFTHYWFYQGVTQLPGYESKTKE